MACAMCYEEQDSSLGGEKMRAVHLVERRVVGVVWFCAV